MKKATRRNEARIGNPDYDHQRIGDFAPRSSLACALAAGCATHRDDYGGSNDIGFTPMYGAYDGAYDGSWNWSPLLGREW